MKNFRFCLLVVLILLVVGCSFFEEDSDSDEIDVITPDAPYLSVFVDEQKIKVYWNDFQSWEADNVEIFRNGSKIANVSGDLSDYTDSGLTIGQTYRYKLRLVKDGQVGDYSPEKSVLLEELNCELSLGDLKAFFVDEQGYQILKLKLKLASEKDVYLVFTNSSETDGVDDQDYSVSSDNISFNSNSNMSIMSSELETKTRFEQAVLPSVGKLIEGEKEAVETKASLFSVSAAVTSVEDTEDFWEVADSPYRFVAATCRKVVSADTKFGNKTLNIWVEDSCWQASCITQTMVDAMADKFLKSGSDNDIYDWVTNICGEEWGSSSKSVIKAGQPIDILLCDIKNDSLTTGGVLGYFWGGNAYTDENYSNQRVMFCIDAPIYANGTGGDAGWNVEDYYPRVIISTLAHEFQHMINFYQLQVLNDVVHETRLNEMLSMSIEDLVAYNLYGDYISSPYYSRFKELNENNDYSLKEWPSADTKYYAINYGFGSYLLRQFDGANFVKNIYATKKKNTDAVEEATGKNFAGLMRNWAAAYLLSDQSVSDSDYDYNDDLGSELNGISYDLVSINAYEQGTPKVFDLNDIESISPLANKYYLLKKDLPAGSYTLGVKMLDEDLRLSVVVK